MVLSYLVYVHIGNNLPDYIYDTIYQTLLINNNSSKIYLLLEDTLIENVKKNISKFNLNNYTNKHFYFENLIEFIPLSVLNDELFCDEQFKKYKELLTTKFNNMSEFRDGFWVSTTARFFYIYTFMKIFNISNVFHIENDVMIYKKLEFLYDYISKNFKDNYINKICMIQDAPNRVIPSLMFFPDTDSLYKLTTHITTTLDKSLYFMNDMNLLGTFDDKYLLEIDPVKLQKTDNLIFDGAAIGQYLGGVDTKNLPTNSKDEDFEKIKISINNPTKGFINETSQFKPNTCIYLKNTVHLDDLKVKPKVFSCKKKDNNKLNHIANLHIHSKQLYQFSSVFNINYDDIITGDKIVGLCDFVILTKEIYNYHKNIDKFAKDIILIKDFKAVNFELLTKYIKETLVKKENKVINLFVYTHILDSFIQYILPNLDQSINYNYYLHNSDHEFNDKHLKCMFSYKSTNHIFAQNINTNELNEKLTLLPLGIANSMWPHGNTIKLYNTIKETYKYKKEKNIYININPKTFGYRSHILDKIKNSNLQISKSTTFSEYLLELSKHRFCLCIRGNGIDTHRFWECLYLGVIPVIINNKYTNCKTFVEYLKKLEVPFYEIKSEDVDFTKKYNKDFFNEKLYQTFLNDSFYNMDFLKLNNYN